MPLNLTESLQSIATLFLEAEKDTDEQLQQRLVDLGMEPTEAKQWSIFMPLAFARAAYRFQLPELNDEQNQYVQCKMESESSDESHTMKLNQFAPYMLAYSWASDCGQMDSITSPEYNAIVRRSIEFKAIQSLRTGAIQTLPPLSLEL